MISGFQDFLLVDDIVRLAQRIDEFYMDWHHTKHPTLKTRQKLTGSLIARFLDSYEKQKKINAQAP